MEPFTDIHALIIDMDGVLWHGNRPLPGLKSFFHLLREQQLPFILATNNASLTQEQYVVKLAKMEIRVDAEEILTSSMATALYLATHNDPTKTQIFVIGEAGAKQPLIEQGFTLTDRFEPANTQNGTIANGADIVVCGKDETLTWDKLATATLNISAGAKFIGTNADVTLPTERGLTHGNGAILAALEAATGKTPTIIGKPEPIIYQQAINLLGVEPAHTIAIGDRLDTDILGAVRANIRSIMVLTGVSTENDLKSSSFQPTWVMPDLLTITQALQK